MRKSASQCKGTDSFVRPSGNGRARQRRSTWGRPIGWSVQNMSLKKFSANFPLAPFEVRSFRYQWPSDLLVSLAFEMETLILGWYVLVETRSVILLTVFGSLQYLGTLIAPMFGVLGDINTVAVVCHMNCSVGEVNLYFQGGDGECVGFAIGNGLGLADNVVSHIYHTFIKELV